jgi:hypothetical protein
MNRAEAVSQPSTAGGPRLPALYPPQAPAGCRSGLTSEPGSAVCRVTDPGSACSGPKRGFDAP